MVVMIFFREVYGDKVNNTCCTLMTKPFLPAGEFLRERYNIVLPTCTKTVLKLFQLTKLWVVKQTWWLDKGYQGRSGKSRRKHDFWPLYHNAAFFSMRGNLKMRLHCIKPILPAPLPTVTSHCKREPTGDKVHNIHVMIFLRVFFYCQNMFFPHELQQICINSTCKWMNCVLRNQWNGTQHVYFSHFRQTGKVAFSTLY